MKRQPEDSEFRPPDRHAPGHRLTLVIFGLAGLLLSGSPASGQVQQAGAVVENREGARQDPAAVEEPTSQLDGSGDYLGGAPLKTDPDLMARLERAEQYRQEGNYRVVAKLWQSVLDQSGDTLFTEDDETYYALTRRVETMLAELPPEGLNAYRISADADAAEILAAAGSDQDLEALSRVVKDYFMSSLGDDAAFRLGCIYLDRFDFGGAMGMFTRIVDHYPDPSIAVEEVWLRIAICFVWTGDMVSAQQALDQARVHGAEATDRLYQAVAALIAGAPDLDTPTGLTGGHWRDRLGGPRRTGVMPALADPPSGKLRAVWQFWFTPDDQYVGERYQGDALVRAGKRAIADTVDKKESKLLDNWRAGQWRPSGALLLDQQKALWKTGADLIAFDRDVLDNPRPVWRSLWLNQFLVDDATETWKQMFDAYGRYGDGSQEVRTVPSRIQEVQLFGDRIAQSMSIHRDIVYSIEGPEYSSLDSRTPSRSRERGYNWGSIPRRTRTNRLVAYDLQTGKMLWSQPLTRLPDESPQSAASVSAEDAAGAIDLSEMNPFEGAGFMAAPVGYGNLLLVPVNLSGSIWIYALDAERQGELAWRSYLCDEPGGGSQPWSPIQMSLDGSTLYALCGTGVVFAVDAMTGMVRFARRHPRTGEPNNLMARFGNQMELLEFDGWLEDNVIPVGNVLLMMASDYNVLWAIDRQTAKFAWRTENRPFGHKFDYLIGIQGDYVYLGGRESVAAVSLKAQGRWAWVYSLPQTSFGQALLTTDALYVPLPSGIQKLGLHGKQGSGDVLATFPVELGTGAPLGNLYSDGEKFWVVGGNRLYVLGDDDGSIVDEEATPVDETAPADETAPDAAGPDADPETTGNNPDDGQVRFRRSSVDRRSVADRGRPCDEQPVNTGIDSRNVF